jgi:glycosyltransferase involved in cell wall biosynthesis
MRIAYLSPMPPAATGVAAYSAAVLRDLRAAGVTRRHRIHVPRPTESPEAAVARSDLAVYHIGNNLRYHGEIYELALRRPGVVVLHDLALDDLVRGLVDAGDPTAERTVAEALVAGERLVADASIDAPLRIPWCALAVRRARAVIVHAPFGRRYLESFGARTPVHVVPHPVPPPAGARARRRARAIRRRLAGRVILGVLGDIGSAKLIDVVLDAAHLIGDPVHVAVVGRRIPGYDVDPEIERRGMADRVTVAADVDDDEFAAWTVASDLVVNLRHPHRGEVSGTVVRALREGIPTAVSAVGTYLDWPEGTVVRIPPGRPDPGDLAGALEPLVREPSDREALGARARAHMDRQARERITARGYVAAIGEALRLARDPALATVERWATAMAEMGATPGSRAAGFGRAYLDALAEVGRPTT